jgi:hypothetical protein
MNIITGEKFQELAECGISKLEQQKFESQNVNPLDVDSYDFNNIENQELIYINSSLINLNKPNLVVSNIYDKLKDFKNPFRLILHNSDQNFDVDHLQLFDIPNCKLIYTQNMNVIDKRVIPLPIGIANSMWKWGNLELLKNIIKSNLDKKTDHIYVNFTKIGGMRDEYRISCYDNMIEHNIPLQPNLKFGEYLHKLSKFKYSICPIGNGLDTYRMWESLYLKVIPICTKNPLVDFYSKLFPIVVIDNWDTFNESNLNTECGWENYDLLDFDKLKTYLNI